MKGFGTAMRDSGSVRFTTALLTALLITSATILPFTIQGAVASPVPSPTPGPESVPDPQAYSPPPFSGLYPEPEPCRGNCSWIHDPSIVYEDGVYWRFSTSGNIAIATAPSLEGPWHYEGALLHDDTSIFVTEGQDIWVSTISNMASVITDTHYYRRPTSSSTATHTTATTPYPLWDFKTPPLASPLRSLSPPAPGKTTARSGFPSPTNTTSSTLMCFKKRLLHPSTSLLAPSGTTFSKSSSSPTTT
jgi:hypothetical protein